MACERTLLAAVTLLCKAFFVSLPRLLAGGGGGALPAQLTAAGKVHLRELDEAVAAAATATAAAAEAGQRCASAPGAAAPPPQPLELSLPQGLLRSLCATAAGAVSEAKDDDDDETKDNEFFVFITQARCTIKFKMNIIL